MKNPNSPRAANMPAENFALTRRRARSALCWLCSCIVAASSVAAELRLGWDASPVTDAVLSYQLYRLSGTSRTLITQIPAGNLSTQLLSVPDGVHAFVLTASNVAGESDPSAPLYVVVSGTNVVAVTRKPGAPLNLQLR